jgi:hypothetical protein
MVKRFLRLISESNKNDEGTETEVSEKKVIPQSYEVGALTPPQSEPSPETQITIDAATGEVVEEAPAPEVVESSDLALVQKQTEIASRLPNHPEDIVKLAAINEAFYKGILALQNLNLDEDLYWQAISDLRKKYYKARDPYLT